MELPPAAVVGMVRIEVQKDKAEVVEVMMQKVLLCLRVSERHAVRLDEDGPEGLVPRGTPTQAT